MSRFRIWDSRIYLAPHRSNLSCLGKKRRPDSGLNPSTSKNRQLVSCHGCPFSAGRLCHIWPSRCAVHFKVSSFMRMTTLAHKHPGNEHSSFCCQPQVPCWKCQVSCCVAHGLVTRRQEEAAPQDRKAGRQAGTGSNDRSTTGNNISTTTPGWLLRAGLDRD